MLLIHPSDEMYGADRVVLMTAEALQPHVAVKVWLPADKRYVARPLTQALQALGCRVTHVPLPVLRRRELTVWGLVRLARSLALIRKDLKAEEGPILLSTSAVLLVSLVIPRRLAWTVHVHETWSPSTRFVLGPLLRRASRIICPSEAVRDRLPPGSQGRTVVVANGTPDPNAHEPTSATEEDGTIHLVVASRWGPWKGHGLLLAAWARLRRKDLRLHILGGAPPTGTGVDVPGLVSDLPNADTVKIHGEVSDIGNYIQGAAAVLLPSTAPEPFGLVAIEAMARGRAVIATDHGGCAEIVNDQTGWLVPPDEDAWAHVLESLSPAELRERGRAGRHRYLEQFSAHRFQKDIRTSIIGVTY